MAEFPEIILFFQDLPIWGWIVLFLIFLYLIGDTVIWDYEVKFPLEKGIGRGEVELERLKKKGATVFIGHQAAHVAGVDLCIFSSAIHKSNPERVACEKRHIPLMRRGEALAHIMHSKHSIGIAGTHGKTTTTSSRPYYSNATS